MAMTMEQHLGVSVRPLPFSKMPVHEWARRIGLNPLHFSGATASGYYFTEQHCSVSWPRFSWQTNNHISHEDVAMALLDAEEAIEEYTKINISPSWRTEEHTYPRYKKVHYTNAIDRTGRRPAIQMQRAKIRQVGSPTRELVGTVEVSYQDADGDGFNEVAYANFLTSYDVTELEFYPAGYAFHPSFQIRWPRYFSAMDGEISVVFDVWLMIKPEKLNYLPVQDMTTVVPDLTLSPNLITHIEVYRVTNDPDNAVTFTWEPDPRNESAGLETQTGSAFIRDGEAGFIAPYFPNGLTKHSPDRVSITYRSGWQSEAYTLGRTLDPMDEYLADAVFHLATARLHRDICGCTNAQALAEELRSDMALSSKQGNFLAVSDKIQDCPFGTRRGEWLAYQQVLRAEKHYEVSIL